MEIRIPFPKDRDFVLAYECQGTTLDSTRANTQKYGSNNYSRQTSPNISNAHSPHTDLSIRYDAGITISDVKEFLSPRLPEYMVPTDLLVVDKLPYSSSIKLDRGLVNKWISDIEHVASPLSAK